MSNLPVLSQAPVVPQELSGRASSMRIFVKNKDVKDILRHYFDHAVWNMKPGDPVPNAPLDVQIELVNRCNLACPACPIHQQTRTKSFLTWDVLQRITDEAATEGVCYFTICGIGEASLHPDLFRFLRYIRDKKVEPKGMRVYEFMPSILISNAMWSTTQVRECIENPPDVLSVSLAGLTDEEIVERRKPIDLDRFYSNVRTIFENRKVVRTEDGGTSPVIHVCTHVYPHEMEERQAEIKAFKEKWFRVADVIVIKPTMVDQHHREFDQFMKGDLLKYDNISLNHFHRTAPCMEVSRRMSIDSDGNVWCGHHNTEDFGSHLGNVYQQSLRDIWHGNEMNKFRRQVRAGIFHRPGCQACGGEIRDSHRGLPQGMEPQIVFADWAP